MDGSLARALAELHGTDEREGGDERETGLSATPGKSADRSRCAQPRAGTGHQRDGLVPGSALGRRLSGDFNGPLTIVTEDHCQLSGTFTSL